MFPILLVLFILVPIIEISLFIQVGGFLGLWPTIAIVLTTAIVGASLVRSQGLMTLLSVQNKMQQGELPAQEIVEGVMLAVAGVLLLTPGFMTDFLGMLVLLPRPRAILAKKLMQRVSLKSMSGSGFGGQFGGGFGSGHNPFERDDNTFDGEFERKDKYDEKNKRDDNDQNRLN
ncbi:membrane protein FxsA [Vibrio sp. SS-MA-C1-2]|uniref:FxsA family protein n=1 Tax=Vibrio sp. SS-MA-C1-2 TaxID=2908646 RepID=UPI001F322B6A|nr:FxsA family protein [Vibrio sp. SS-MA-C1-2]UJF19499.1 membrane protein FxsA [Vibrio sp. SS-MA-C1-2]